MSVFRVVWHSYYRYLHVDDTTVLAMYLAKENDFEFSTVLSFHNICWPGLVLWLIGDHVTYARKTDRVLRFVTQEEEIKPDSKREHHNLLWIADAKGIFLRLFGYLFHLLYVISRSYHHQIVFPRCLRFLFHRNHINKILFHRLYAKPSFRLCLSSNSCKLSLKTLVNIFAHRCFCQE